MKGEPRKGDSPAKEKTFNRSEPRKGESPEKESRNKLPKGKDGSMSFTEASHCRVRERRSPQAVYVVYRGVTL